MQIEPRQRQRNDSIKGKARSIGTGPHPPAPPSFPYLPPLDPAMKIVEEQALQVAGSDETILLLGETGVGKDVMARRIHDASPRAAKRFVQINCAALPDGLLESELFGHMRGSFTGAVESQQGQFEVAAWGTIFLDEIGELSPRLQAKLLHVLQEKRFCRVGGREPIEAKVRVIAATNQDLDRAMARGEFRRDLYYRLCVVCLRIPSLRQRPHDVEGLAKFFALKYSDVFNRPELADVGPHVIAAMKRHPFEGNVRELENLVKRAILLGGYDQILGSMLQRVEPMPEPVMAQTAPAESFTQPSGPIPLKELARLAVEKAERQAIIQALLTTRWNRRRAAQLLKVSYRSLLYKMRDYSILPEGAEDPDLLAHEGEAVVSPREGSC